MTKTLLIDDEPFAVENLRAILQKIDPSVQVIGAAYTLDDAFDLILEEKPDLIFLDIEMPGGTGFDLLQEIQLVGAEVIIVTAFEGFAIQAIKNNALDYILKPINKIELLNATQKAKAKIQQKHTDNRPTQAQAAFANTTIALPTNEGFIFAHLDDIIYLESDSKYTTLHFKKQKPVMVSKNIGDYEALLPHTHFIRIHNKYIVNTAHIANYIKGRGGYIVLENGKTLDVSERKKDEFLNLFKK